MTRRIQILLIIVLCISCSVSRQKDNSFDFVSLEKLTDSISNITTFDSLETIIIYENAEELVFINANRYHSFLLSDSDTIEKYSQLDNYYEYQTGVRLLKLDLTQYLQTINVLRKNKILKLRKHKDLYYFTKWRFLDNEDGYVYSKNKPDLKKECDYLRTGKCRFKKINDNWHRYSTR